MIQDDSIRWQQPIFDRTQTDIDNKTPKGFLNVADLERITGNIGFLREYFGLSGGGFDMEIKFVKTKAVQTITAQIGANQTREYGTVVIPPEVTPENLLGTYALPNAGLSDCFMSVDFVNPSGAKVYCHNMSGALDIGILNGIDVNVVWAYVDGNQVGK